jgi:hypothetical protein
MEVYWIDDIKELSHGEYKKLPTVSRSLFKTRCLSRFRGLMSLKLSDFTNFVKMVRL